MVSSIWLSDECHELMSCVVFFMYWMNNCVYKHECMLRFGKMGNKLDYDLG